MISDMELCIIRVQTVSIRNAIENLCLVWPDTASLGVELSQLDRILPRVGWNQYNNWVRAVSAHDWVAGV